MTAASTGLRAGELSKLTPRHLTLAGDCPAVRLSADETKNGRACTQPLPPQVAAELAEYATDLAPSQRLRCGSWSEKAADMIRDDLDRAGEPYEVAGPSGLLVADFHCLRGTYIGLLEAAGASLREVMTLARHSDPKLRLAVYGKLGLNELGSTARLLQLPACSPVVTPHVPRHVPQPVLAADCGCGRVATLTPRLEDGGERNPLGVLEVEDGCGPLTRTEKTPPVGFEPTTRRLTAGWTAVKTVEKIRQLVRVKSLGYTLVTQQPTALTFSGWSNSSGNSTQDSGRRS